MVSFVNFARIASICVGFHLGTLHGYFFHQDFWPNLNFPLECQIKLVLIIRSVAMVTIISIATIGGSYFWLMWYLPTKFRLAMSWNGQI